MKSRQGAALIEAMAALSVLAISAAAISRAIVGLSSNVAAIATQERLMHQASRVLSALTLLRREELLRREGLTTIGEFTVEVRRTNQTCVRVSVQPQVPTSSALTTIVCEELLR